MAGLPGGPVTDGTGTARYIHLHSGIIIPLISHLSHLRSVVCVGTSLIIVSLVVMYWLLTREIF